MRFRFRLRSLLILVALSAFACWAYWIGWPWWQIHRFESALRNLKAGVTERDIRQLSPGHSHSFSVHPTGDLFGMTAFVKANYVYCVYYTYPTAPGVTLNYPCDSVSVFRLPRVPPDYPLPNDDREINYIGDFLVFISKTPTIKPSSIKFKYELIHADPPDAAK